MPNLVTLLVRWASELKRFQTIDEHFALGKFQRRNTIYRALPESIKSVRKELSPPTRISSTVSRTYRDQVGSTLRRHPSRSQPTYCRMRLSVSWSTQSMSGSRTSKLRALQEQKWETCLPKDCTPLYAIAKGKGRTAKGQPKGYGATKGNGKGTG